MIKRYFTVIDGKCKFAEIDIETTNNQTTEFLYQINSDMSNLIRGYYSEWELGCRDAIELSRLKGIHSGYIIKRLSGIEVDTDYWSTWIATIKAIEELHQVMLISDADIKSIVLGNKGLA